MTTNSTTAPAGPSAMFRVGRALLVGTLVIGVPASFVPLIGWLFIFPFPDAVLTALALMAAGSLRLAGHLRIGVALAIWGVSSVAIEIFRVPAHLAHSDGVLTAATKVMRPLDLEKGSTISLTGNVNAFVSAHGPPMFVTADMNQGGARGSFGRVLASGATAIEIIDELWSRGYTPEIRSQTYPMMSVSRVTDGGWVRLSISVEDAPGQVAAEFRRSFHLPRPHPAGGIENLLGLPLSVLHDNFLRHHFGLNDEANISRDVSNFLSLVLPKGQDGRGVSDPKRRLRIAQDVQVPLQGGVEAEAFLAGLRTDARIDRQALRYESCGQDIRGREYGANGMGSYVQIFNSKTTAFPEVVTRVAPDHAAFDYLCSPSSGMLTTFMQVGSKPALRVSTYAKEGHLFDVKFYGLPFRLHRFAVVDRSSIKIGNAGLLSFSVGHPVIKKIAPHEEIDKTSYRRIDFVSE